ncbi:hypothetical protein RHS01_08621 [Rhizoctonia solani]|uniref:Uncharacterized protein n=1 Tax=Rhizoctonia solani TaxID=456999 RepID=A0A8H7I8X4_9AGAM|nr:hypothetical protein RHS01_08621 [Rhizoctonia solani]
MAPTTGRVQLRKSSTALGNNQGSQMHCHADQTMPTYPPADQTMLPDPIFAKRSTSHPRKRSSNAKIEASLDQDESLEEILQFLQTSQKLLLPSKGRSRTTKMEAGLLFYQGRIVVPDVGTIRTDLLRIFHDSP